MPSSCVLPGGGRGYVSIDTFDRGLTQRRVVVRVECMMGAGATRYRLLLARFRRGLAGSAEAARRLGVERVLPKPFTRNELLAAVREPVGS
jgi:hypothetical protein